MKIEKPKYALTIHTLRGIWIMGILIALAAMGLTLLFYEIFK